MILYIRIHGEILYIYRFIQSLKLYRPIHLNFNEQKKKV